MFFDCTLDYQFLTDLFQCFDRDNDVALNQVETLFSTTPCVPWETVIYRWIGIHGTIEYDCNVTLITLGYFTYLKGLQFK
jgi:hypothetical protein